MSYHVQVDEEGTEAAAVTLIGLSDIATEPIEEEPFVMRVDRPFMFLIKENRSGTILFMGKIVRPD